MNDDFEQMAHAARADARTNLDNRVERERRLQNRSRRIRTVCRFVILIAGPIGIGMLFSGILFGWRSIAGWGCTLMFPTIVATTVLFFMGGLAPGRARKHLSDRERNLLDN